MSRLLPADALAPRFHSLAAITIVALFGAVIAAPASAFAARGRHALRAHALAPSSSKLSTWPIRSASAASIALRPGSTAPSSGSGGTRSSGWACAAGADPKTCLGAGASSRPSLAGAAL